MIMASNHHQHHDDDDHTQLNQIYFHHHQDFGMMHPSSSSTPFSRSLNNINRSGASYDLSDLDDQALFMFLHDGEDIQPAQNSGMRPPTLNIFPSQPMHVEPQQPPTANSSGLVSPGGTSGSMKSSGPDMELTNPNSDLASAPEPHKVVKREGSRKGHGNEGPKSLDPKVLRRLAQNREAARKSRLRKKAYVQQLESSRMRLAQLEQELQRATSQGSLLLGGNNLLPGEQGNSGSAGNTNTANSDSVAFDMHYARWLDADLRIMVELREAVNDHSPGRELQVLVEKSLGHYDQLVNLKSMMAKSDVFHILSGLWKTPTERCLIWMGDIRPSHLIKISISQLDPLTQPEFMAICNLEESTRQAEEGITGRLETFYQSLSDAVVSPESLSVNTYRGQMGVAMNKLSSLDGFVRQADGLRRETLHRLVAILKPFQAAKCMVGMTEYVHRVRSLNNYWTVRNRQQQGLSTM